MNNPRYELKQIIVSLDETNKRIRDIQVEVTTHGSYYDQLFTIRELDILRQGIDDTVNKILEMEVLKRNIFKEFNIKNPEEDDTK